MVASCRYLRLASPRLRRHQRHRAPAEFHCTAGAGLTVALRPCAFSRLSNHGLLKPARPSSVISRVTATALVKTGRPRRPASSLSIINPRPLQALAQPSKAAAVAAAAAAAAAHAIRDRGSAKSSPPCPWIHPSIHPSACLPAPRIRLPPATAPTTVDAAAAASPARPLRPRHGRPWRPPIRCQRVSRRGVHKPRSTIDGIQKCSRAKSAAASALSLPAIVRLLFDCATSNQDPFETFT